MSIEPTIRSSLGGHRNVPTPWNSRRREIDLRTCAHNEVPYGILEVSPAVSKEEVTIRLPDRPDWRPCGSCGLRFHAAGPTGYLGKTAICDPCTLERSEALGSLLFLGLAVRAFVAFDAVDREQRYRALDELGAVARVYERMVAPWGPARTLALADLLAGGGSRGEGGRKGGDGSGEEPIQG